MMVTKLTGVHDGGDVRTITEGLRFWEGRVWNVDSFGERSSRTLIQNFLFRTSSSSPFPCDERRNCHCEDECVLSVELVWWKTFQMECNNHYYSFWKKFFERCSCLVFVLTFMSLALRFLSSVQRSGHSETKWSLSETKWSLSETTWWHVVPLTKALIQSQ